MLKKCSILLFIFILSAVAYADMGAIVPAANVVISEPSQKAIIFYNGTKEVLILGTDLDTSSPAGVLRFIPLPSEPEVSLALEGCFDKLNQLVTTYNIKYLVQYKGLGGSQEGDAVELRFHKKLGAHDITVVKVNDAVYFRKWVNDYFSAKELIQRNTYPEIENIVSDYVARGIAYFVFDFVELSENITSVRPLVYQFESEKLYYPLKTSNIFGGTGRIDLIIFAPYAQRGFLGVYFQASTSAVVNAQELIDIYPKAVDFFKDRRIILQAFKREGELNFKYDILMDYNSGLEELKPYDPRKKH